MKVKILSGFILNGKQVSGQVIDYDVEQLKKLKIQYQPVNEKLSDTRKDVSMGKTLS